MKYIVFLGDGMADYPNAELGNKTPLELAKKPNMDYFAQKGICGMAKTVPEGMKPGSDTANLSVMGYAPEKYYTGRSPLEAVSVGVPLNDADITFRANLVTLSDEEKLRRFRSEGSAKEAMQRSCVMIGRGLLMHPGMGSVATADEKPACSNLWKFHDAVYEGYCDYIQGDKNMLFKMKELWSYFSVNFDEGDPFVKKAIKQLRKSQSRADYESAIRGLRR